MHVFITQSQSFEQRKKYIKDDHELFHFDLNENYSFMSHDDIQSDQLDHTSYTLFAVMVYYRDSKNAVLLKKESDYLNYRECPVSKFLGITSDEF